MKRAIAIVGGTGPEGAGLAARWLRAGETVIIGSREARRAEQTAERLREATGCGERVRGVVNEEAVKATDLVVLTVPLVGQIATVKQLKPLLKAGTILVDATVPLAPAIGGRATRTLKLWAGSAAEQAAELVGKNVTVVGAFQNLSAELLRGEKPVECDVIVCSDDDTARKTVQELAEKIPGVRGLDGGRLENARIVEQLTALLITLNVRHKVHHAGIRVTGVGGEK